MSVESQIAWRYLFSKKGHSAINIISSVAAAAVAVVTAALVCVMSVMNGFSHLIEDMFSEFDPELRITSAEGKYFSTTDEAITAVRSLPYVAVFSEQIEENAMLQYDDHRLPATVLGVDDNFQLLTHIDSIIVSGHYSVYDGQFERAVLGQGLATLLGVHAYTLGGIRLYAPRRTHKVNMLRPDDSFNEAGVYAAGLFAVNQVQYDDRYMLVSLPLARTLFEYDSTTVTAVGLRISGVRLDKAEREIQAMLGNRYRVENRYEQQADFFRIVRIEKLLTALLLIFILCIAGFNSISSLAMLIIDKRESIRTLSHLGAGIQQIRRIFLYEGWFISTMGALSGIVLGVAVCLSQQHWGWLKLGNGTDYIVTAYPVCVEPLDVLFITLIVLVLGYLAALYPSRKITIKE